jgi:hypothetical protein
MIGDFNQRVMSHQVKKLIRSMLLPKYQVDAFDIEAKLYATHFILHRGLPGEYIPASTIVDIISQPQHTDRALRALTTVITMYDIRTQDIHTLSERCIKLMQSTSRTLYALHDLNESDKKSFEIYYGRSVEDILANIVGRTDVINKDIIQTIKTIKLDKVCEFIRRAIDINCRVDVYPKESPWLHSSAYISRFDRHDEHVSVLLTSNTTSTEIELDDVIGRNGRKYSEYGICTPRGLVVDFMPVFVMMELLDASTLPSDVLGIIGDMVR